MRDAITAACGRFSRILGGVGIVLVGLLAFPVAYDAVARFLGHPTIWVFETTLYALIAAGFLTNGLALSTGSHFRITLLSQLFPGARRWLDRVAMFVTLVFAIAFTYASAQFVVYSFQFDIRSNTLLSIPQFLPQLALPVGGIALALQALGLLLTDQMPTDVPADAAEAMLSERN
jgi:C4-dicarboxylate transporter DctQ subunit